MLHYCVLHAFLRAAWISGWQSYLDDCVLHYCRGSEAGDSKGYAPRSTRMQLGNGRGDASGCEGRSDGCKAGTRGREAKRLRVLGFS